MRSGGTEPEQGVHILVGRPVTRSAPSDKIGCHQVRPHAHAHMEEQREGWQQLTGKTSLLIFTHIIHPIKGGDQITFRASFKNKLE